MNYLRRFQKHFACETKIRAVRISIPSSQQMLSCIGLVRVFFMYIVQIPTLCSLLDLQGAQAREIAVTLETAFPIMLTGLT